jgi:hypothetical protein
MVHGGGIPIICRHCGSNRGHLDSMELNFIINTQREELTTLRAKIADLERDRVRLGELIVKECSYKDDNWDYNHPNTTGVECCFSDGTVFCDKNNCPKIIEAINETGG